MPDYRRMMDPGPNDPVTPELLRQWNPGAPQGGMGLDPVYSDRYLLDEGSQDTLGNLIQTLQGASNRTENIDAGLGRLQGLQEEQKANLQPLWDQGKESSPGFLDQLSGGLGSVGGALSRGLDAITPSQGTVDNLAMRLQNAHAIGTGRTPLWMQQQEHQMQLGQQQELMQMRRAQLAQQMAQQQEMKRGHDLGLLEKALSHPKGSALLEQLANDPQFSLSHQAGLLHKGFKEADFGSFEAYKEFIPEDVQQRFIAGKLPAHELNAWLDEARTATKENAKANAKQAILTRAINKPVDQRTPHEALLVEEHQAALEVEKLKPQKMQSEIDENKAQAEHYRKQAETGGSDKLLGVDREAITQELYGPKTRYSTLDQKGMKQVNDRLLNFQGTQQFNKSMAAQQAQLQVPDKPSPQEREKTTGDFSTIDLLDSLNQNFSEDWVGPFRGRGGEVMEKYGGSLGVPEIGQDEAKFRAKLATFKNRLIKEITGAQMSEPEAERILQEAPDYINPPPVFKARMAATRENLKMIAKRRQEVMKGAGIDTSGLPQIGQKSKIAPQQKQAQDKVQSVLDEVLGK